MTKMESLIVKDFDLAKTMECGQFFRYDFLGNNTFFISHRDKLFKVRQDGEKLYFSGADKKFITDFFRLDEDYKAIIKSISKDDFIRKAIKANYGMRLIRQDPWECLISYICSANNNIPRIKKNLIAISETFGSPIAHEGHKGYAFPAPGKLNNIAALKACKVGFRAGFIQQTNNEIKDGEIMSLRDIDYSAARERLMRLNGVGEKIADCVCLFALNKYEAFPVDVWVRRVMVEHYLSEEEAKRNIKNGEIGDFARGYFGKYAGYANQFLFYYRRLQKMPSQPGE
jgi:N-glycosylase/DNA lyase